MGGVLLNNTGDPCAEVTEEFIYGFGTNTDVSEHECTRRPRSER